MRIRGLTRWLRRGLVLFLQSVGTEWNCSGADYQETHSFLVAVGLPESSEANVQYCPATMAVEKNQCWWGLLQIFSFSTVPLSNPRTTGYWDERQPVQLLGFCWNWPNFVRCSQDRDTSLPKKFQSKILGCLAHSCQVWATPVGTERFGRALFDSPLNPQLFSLWKGHSCSSRLVCKCWTGGRWSSTDQCVFYGWSCLCVCFSVF